MERIWLKRYLPYVPEEIDINTYTSLIDVFEESVAQFGDRPAYTNLGKTITYAELDKLSRDFAAYLTQVAGMKKGDRIAIMMPNLLQYPVVLFAAIRAGLIIVNTNPLYTPRELKHQLNDAGASAIVVLENFAHTLEVVLDETPINTIITTQIGDMAGCPKRTIVNFVVKRVKKMVPAFNLPTAVPMNAALKLGATEEFNNAELGHDDLAFLQYTGGTTGVSKGAMLTHGNMIANVLQAHSWAANDLVPGEETVITALPLYHIFALTANALFAMKLGAKSVLITNPRDLPAFVKELGKEQFNYLTGINTLFNALLNTPGFDQLDFSNLKVVLGGGMAVQRAVAEKWQQVTGGVLFEAYGLTETSPAVTINPLDITEYNGSIGLPLSSTEISIRDDSGNEVELGERGELCIRGPQVMAGYWNRPDETADSIDADGWLKTGDVATINEQGFIKLVDRLKDMILVSGFNVYPNEVEDIVASHPKVLEVGAIGVADDKSTEAVKVIVVKKDDSLSKEELQTHCHEFLTNYKCPKHIEFVDELPKTNVGKILRRELRDLYGKA